MLAREGVSYAWVVSQLRLHEKKLGRFSGNLWLFVVMFVLVVFLLCMRTAYNILQYNLSVESY